MRTKSLLLAEWFHYTAMGTWQRGSWLAPMTGHVARMAGPLAESNFALYHYFALLLDRCFILPFQCVKVSILKYHSCKTHLNKSAKLPGDSRTPSDRQASLKCTLKSAPNARCPPPSCFIQFAQLLCRTDAKDCPGAGEFSYSTRNWQCAELIPSRIFFFFFLLRIKVCISGRHGSTAPLCFSFVP